MAKIQNILERKKEFLKKDIIIALFGQVLRLFGWFGQIGDVCP